MLESTLGRLAEQLKDALPKGGTEAALKAEAEALVRAAANKLDLVSRDEFDALQAVLLASRARLEQLEAQLAELQAQTTDAEE